MYVCMYIYLFQCIVYNNQVCFKYYQYKCQENKEWYIFCIKIKGKLWYIDLVREIYVIFFGVNELLGGKILEECVYFSYIVDFFKKFIILEVILYISVQRVDVF